MESPSNPITVLLRLHHMNKNLFAPYVSLLFPSSMQNFDFGEQPKLISSSMEESLLKAKRSALMDLIEAKIDFTSVEFIIRDEWESPDVPNVTLTTTRLSCPPATKLNIYTCYFPSLGLWVAAETKQNCHFGDSRQVIFSAARQACRSLLNKHENAIHGVTIKEIRQ